MPTSGALIAWAKEHGVSVRGLGLDAVPPADDLEKEMQRLNQVRGLYDEAELQTRYIEFYRNRARFSDFVGSFRIGDRIRNWCGDRAVWGATSTITPELTRKAEGG
jgi:hypothetical protein